MKLYYEKVQTDSIESNGKEYEAQTQSHAGMEADIWEAGFYTAVESVHKWY